MIRSKTPWPMPRLWVAIAVVPIALLWSACGGSRTPSSQAPPPPKIAVSITPAGMSTAMNSTVQFAASVSGTADNRVTWSIVETGGGSISDAGLYTAPLSQGTYHVRAVSVVDPTRSGTADVTVNNALY